MSKRCECCKKRFMRYELTLDEDIHCGNCNFLKYKKGSHTLRLCRPQCSKLYWWVGKHLTPEDSMLPKIRYCLIDDECINCGITEYPSAIFSGTRFNIKVKHNSYFTCECCKTNDTRYRLVLNDDVYCNKCDHLKYKKGKKLNICSTLCPKRTKINETSWLVVKYLTKKWSIPTKLIYSLRNDICTNCGDVSSPKATFSGKQMMEI